jgi:hypothetical protein
MVATLYPPASQLDDVGRGARYAAAHGGGVICPSLWTLAAGTTLRVCGELQAGVMWASGAGLSVGHGRVQPLALIDVAPTLELPLSERFFTQVSIFGGWMMLRPRFDWSVAGMPRHVQPEPWMLGARISLMGRLL